MKYIIHVNQHVIRANKKNDANDPVLTVKTYKSNEYAHEVILKDKQGNVIGKVCYRKDNPLSCGARVWLEFNDRNIDIEQVVHTPVHSK